MKWGEEPTTRPDIGDINYRHGLIMREVEELKSRIEFLERTRVRSIRPQQVQTAGISLVVAGIVTGVVQGLAALIGR